VTFRTKLLLVSSLTIGGCVALVTGAVSAATRRSFERIDAARREALLAQFRAEMGAQGRDVARRMETTASSAEVQQILAGAAEYDAAKGAAEAQGLDFLDVVRPDLTIVSSAHWPARFGYKNDWQIASEDWKTTETFLARIPTPEGSAVGLIAIREAPGGAFVLGGRRLDPAFLKSLGLAPGMRALLWLGPRDVADAQGAIAQPEKLDALIAEVRNTGGQSTGTVQWGEGRASAEAFLAVPLDRRGKLMGVLLAGASLAEQVNLERAILWSGVIVGGSGIVIGVLLGWWTTERITRPVERLAEGARAVAGGDWSAQVEVLSHDEIGELARAFNQMTAQLLEQRDRAIQAERVAAWRELARRLAHELKNPLFPLQITIENLQRARAGSDAEFDEVFRESTTTLLNELAVLKTIVGRFSDFARMPAPRFEEIDLRELVRDVLKLYDAHPKIQCAAELPVEPVRIAADPEQLRRALTNLVLNGMDAMPEGGALRVRVAATGTGARLEVSDSGQGLTEEECARLFTPYYTTKQHGTGLGLAIVQSVVSDHHGKIAVVSRPGEGATFIIDLPREQTV
jgi:two-component system nitrogen regulation sensor histidine kinase NtrY